MLVAAPGKKVKIGPAVLSKGAAASERILLLSTAPGKRTFSAVLASRFTEEHVLYMYVYSLRLEDPFPGHCIIPLEKEPF